MELSVAGWGELTRDILFAARDFARSLELSTIATGASLTMLRLSGGCVEEDGQGS